MQRPTRLQALSLSIASAVAVVGVGAAIMARPVLQHHHAASHSSSPRVNHHSRLSFRVAVWNEKSFPAMRAYKYRHDLLGETSSGWAKAPALAYLGAEFDPANGETQLTEQYAATHHLTVRTGYNETPRLQMDTINVLRDQKRLHVLATHAAIYHPAPGGPHSPARRYVATYTTVGPFKVVFVALHTTAGCFPGQRHSRWYPLSCRALREEIATMQAWVADQHANGWTVVVGGDMNTERPITWGSRQATMTPRDLMQATVVPANGVNAALVSTTTVASDSDAGLWTDHTLSDATFTLSQ